MIDLSDDMIAAHTPALNVICHRPECLNSLEPACHAATSDGKWDHYGAYRVRLNGADLCHEPHCFPKGWASE